MDKKGTIIALFICVMVSLMSSTTASMAQDTGDRANIIAWCYDEDSAIRLGNESIKGFEAHRAFLQSQGNTCIYAGGRRFNATIIEKTFKIGILQFWLVLPDRAPAPVWVWTIVKKDTSI